MIHMVMHQRLVDLTSRWYQERNDRRHPTLWSIDFSQRVTVRWNINGGSEGFYDCLDLFFESNP